MVDTLILDKSLKKISTGAHLDLQESRELFQNMLNLSDEEGMEVKYKIAAILSALTLKGVHENELNGLLNVMLEKSLPITKPKHHLLDIVGTGGDGKGTFNISTTVSIILATCGVKVAKHGNRAASSKCGSADVLQALGIDINIPPERCVKMLEETNFCFLLAPNYHPSLKNIMPIRRALPVKTIFNFAGPIANPLTPEYVFLGTSDKNLMGIYTKILLNRNVKRALVISGDDGMDEITLSTTTSAVLIDNGTVQEFKINPVEHGFKVASEDEVKGDDATYNAQIIERLFKGELDGPMKDIVLLNAGYALFVSEKVESPEEGIQIARDVLDSKKAYEKLNQLREFQLRGE